MTILKPNPIITDFSPKILNEGDILRVFGQYLAEDYNQIIKAYFGDFSDDDIFSNKKPYYKSSTELRFIVQLKDKVIRKSPIKILIYDGYNENILSKSELSKDILTTRPLTIVDNVSSSANENIIFNPIAKRGEIVTITGKFAISDYAKITLRFSGSSTDVKPEVAISIVVDRFKVRVPSDAKSGSVKVTKQDWGPGTTKNSLTVL